MAHKKNREHIKDFWLNQSKAALACEVTRKTFIDWKVPHIHDDGQNGKYYLVADIIANRVDNALARAKKYGHVSPDEAKEELHAAKLEETRARTENWELKNAMLRKESAPIKVIEYTLGNVGAQISSILDGVLPAIKRRNPRLSSVDLEIIKQEIVKAQNAASEITVDLSEFEDA